MATVPLGSLTDALGQTIAQLNAEQNRARVDTQDRLRQLAAMGLQRRRGIADSLASSGMVHSGVNLQQQTELGQNMDEERARLNQGLNDRLANIARQRIGAQHQFNISRMMPR